MKVLLIDNYDSFTYNLYHEIANTDVAVKVIKNDDESLDEILCKSFDAVVISPGPKRPKDSGKLMALMPTLVKKPLLGICLGHQAIGEYYGARLDYCEELVHGKAFAIQHQNEGLFKGVPAHMKAVTYNSLRLAKKPWPDELRQSAHLADGTIMAFSHFAKPIYGLQFHPESIGTTFGALLLNNFLQKVKIKV